MCLAAAQNTLQSRLSCWHAVGWCWRHTASVEALTPVCASLILLRRIYPLQPDSATVYLRCAYLIMGTEHGGRIIKRWK